jgi:site-specific recombinase XerD
LQLWRFSRESRSVAGLSNKGRGLKWARAFFSEVSKMTQTSMSKMTHNWLAEFSGFLLSEGLADGSIAEYSRILQQFLRDCPNPLSASTADIVRFLSKHFWSPATTQLVLATLKRFFRFLFVEGFRSDDPTAFLQPPKVPKPLPRYLSQTEVAQLLDRLTEVWVYGRKRKHRQFRLTIRDAAILELLYATGMRVGELVKLKVSDLDLDAQTVRVNGKGDKERICFFGRVAKERLMAWLDERQRWLQVKNAVSDWLFIGKRSPLRPLRRETVIRLVNRYSMATISKRISPHWLRHSFAAHLLEGGANIIAIGELLGHSRLTTTERYCFVVPSLLWSHYAFHPKAKGGEGDDRKAFAG